MKLDKEDMKLLLMGIITAGLLADPYSQHTPLSASLRACEYVDEILKQGDIQKQRNT